MARRHAERSDSSSSVPGFTRRAFLGASAAGGALLWSRGLDAFVPAGGNALAGDAPFLEKTIPQLQAMMASGALTSLELTRGYIDRIAALNPVLRAVVEINPSAIAIATRLDAERRQGRGLRGPLHGIPILVKDNIATDDQMQTTAGSLALVNSRVPGDAPIAERLRSAGAVILGKANLGEWANFRGFNPLGFYGWSARGGATHNPYQLGYSAFGSSSGSGVAPAANLCAAAIGTETDGSIVGPSNVNLVVGLKPTLGLVSQAGIIPISHAQDTAGPIARTVTDVATLLGVIQSPFGEVAGHQLPANYTQFLQRGALEGARIGVDRRFFDDYAIFGFPGDEDALAFAEQALVTMQSLGATLVDVDSGDIFGYFGDEFTALLFEFKADIAAYLATLGHTTMRTLADLIEFNLAHCPAELEFYGQELFELAESTTDLSDPVYLAARAAATTAARTGIDAALAAGNVDVIVAPHLTNSTAPAVSGYPNLGLPLGLRSDGKPAGLMMYTGFLREPRLLALAYDLEQELQVRQQPELLGAVEDPPDAGLCTAPRKPHVFTGKQHLPHGRFFW
ncbi:MAG TPA: amidase family protein [Vicinamibacterales bacterium]|nr:amidase family protein [Vicinamibacterales bacterium]